MAALATIPLLNKRQASKLIDVADASLGSLTRAIEAWLKSLQSLKVSELQRADIRSYLQRRIAGAGLEASRNSVQDVFARIVNAGGMYGLAGLSRIAVRKETVGAAMSFSMVNPYVTEFIQRYMLDLVTGVSLDTRAAIALIISNALQRGGSPREQVRLIQPLIGLTSRQAQAVINYRNALETGNYRATLDRALRDGRYDASVLRALKDGKGLSRDRIDQMVRRYAERSLRYRAETIARTESIRAANVGLRESWRQAVEQRLLPTGLRQHWLLATDERTCPQCKQIVAMNPDGVAMGTAFNSPYGPIEQPPAHPSCRCALGLK